MDSHERLTRLQRMWEWFDRQYREIIEAEKNRALVDQLLREKDTDE